MSVLSITGLGSELLDQPDADPSVVAESLRNIARANRWFGGAAAVRWGAARGIRLVPVGLELNRSAAALARSSGLATAVGCAGAPPVRDKGVDVVLVSQVAHHLTHASVVQLVRIFDRLARRAVILADLRRHPFAPPSFWCGARLLQFDPITVADGMTSLRRGFTRLELENLMARAGITGRVDQRPGFRLVATWVPQGN
jgi:hypothetical protein